MLNHMKYILSEVSVTNCQVFLPFFQPKLHLEDYKELLGK